jgi:hypothetical protein
MSIRKIGGVATAAVTLVAVVTFAYAQNETKKADPAGHSEAMMACAKACSDCQRVCDMCSTHCARMIQEGKKEHFTTLLTCQDCATVCVAASQIVARGGPFTNAICQTCADVCGKCAAECEKFPNDTHMKACAEECRKCEKACKDMLAHAPGK